MANRMRKVQLKFWVTEEERAIIERKMEMLKTKNMGAYLRKMAIALPSDFTSDPRLGEFCVLRIQLDADVVPPHLLCHHAGCTAPEEGIENNAPFGTTGQKTGFNQLRGIGRIVTAFEGNRIDHPHIPLVAHGIDHAVGDLPMFTRPVDGLGLRLAGNGLAVFAAALHTALEPFSRCRSNRLRDCLGVKEILAAFGQQRLQDFEAVTDVDCIKLYGYLPPIFCVSLKCLWVYL